MLFGKFLSEIISAENSLFKFLFKNLVRMLFENLFGNISANIRRDRLWKLFGQHLQKPFSKIFGESFSKNHLEMLLEIFVMYI